MKCVALSCRAKSSSLRTGVVRQTNHRLNVCFFCPADVERSDSAGHYWHVCRMQCSAPAGVRAANRGGGARALRRPCHLAGHVVFLNAQQRATAVCCSTVVNDLLLTGTMGGNAAGCFAVASLTSYEAAALRLDARAGHDVVVLPRSHQRGNGCVAQAFGRPNTLIVARRAAAEPAYQDE